MAKHLIITADDFGAHDFIDNGIKQALEKNIVNSVSVFVTYPDSEARINKLISFRKEKNLGFEIGLHFSITAGAPLTPSKTMTRQLNGKTIFKEVHEHDFKNVSPAELDVELIAQHRKLKSILENHPQLSTLSIDHITHHHGVVYFFEHLFKAYVNTIKNIHPDAAIRSPMPWHKTDLSYKPLSHPGMLPIMKDGLSTGLKTFVHNLYSLQLPDGQLRKIIVAQTPKKIRDVFMKAAKEKNICYPFCYADTIYGQRTPGYMMVLLKGIRDYPFPNLVVEFMMHLGDTTVDVAKVKDVPVGINQKYFQGRQNELNALLGVIDWDAALANGNIRKTNFGKLRGIVMD